MRKRLSYRKAKKGIAEQYSISINQDIVRSLGICLLYTSDAADEL